MKREGRQHGHVRTYWLVEPFSKPPPSSARQPIDSPSTAGLLTRVPSKPTNHSKFTGKCGRPRCFFCRSHPVSKSMAKTKGSYKLRGFWDGRVHGYSASGVLDEMIGSSRVGDHDFDSYGSDDDDDDEVWSVEWFDDQRVESGREMDRIVFEDGDDGDRGHCGGIEMEDDIVGEIDASDGESVRDDEDWGFVGFVLDQVDGEEGWALVGGMI